MTGAFAGHEGALAAWTDGGWRFVAPVDGMRFTDFVTGVEVAFRDGGWTSGALRATELMIEGTKVVGPRAGAISDPAGGTVTDSQVRAAVTQILNALRQHGLIAN